MANKIKGNNEASKRYKDRNRERVRESDRKHKKETYYIIRKNRLLMTQYGITIDDYNKMFENQGGKCLGCYRHQSEIGHFLCVDHDHSTNLIRGLLCRQCNLILGNSLDNPETLENLAAYLRNGEEQT